MADADRPAPCPQGKGSPALLRPPTQFPIPTKEVHDDQYVLLACPVCQHHGRRLSAGSHGGPEGSRLSQGADRHRRRAQQAGVAARIQAQLAGQQIASVVFDGTQPNPTVGNVRAGLAQLGEGRAVRLRDLAGRRLAARLRRGIALCATNGGDCRLRGRTARQTAAALVAINTTAGTASEMTRFASSPTRRATSRWPSWTATSRPSCPSTTRADAGQTQGPDRRHRHGRADPCGGGRPPPTPITDACALKAVELIARHLRTAVNPWRRPERPRADGVCAVPGRHGVQQRIAGLCACHGAPAGRLSTTCPRRVQCALLLPHVEAFSVPTSAARLRDVAHAMGVNVAGAGRRSGRAGLPGRHPPAGAGWAFPNAQPTWA